MEESYRFPVYFDCPGLDGEKKKRIKNYFQIRRKAGGGECGSVTDISPNVYSIAFKDRQAQERVLEKSEHMVDFAGGPLVLTVRSSPGPHKCSPITSSPSGQYLKPKLDLSSSPEQKQYSLPATSLPSSDDKYELQPDTYVLQYLNESPKAWSKLENELKAVACSAQLYLKEGRVLLRRSAQPVAAGEVKNWKSKVDKIFAGYMCHYELDPQKVKALLPFCSSLQTSDEVKVYSEAGMAAVVGECSQVSARLKAVEDLTVKHRGSSLTEKQTIVCRLGEPKLRLLWKVIRDNWGKDFPGVNISQGDTGQLVLEGSAEEILKASNWISDKEKFVLERTVEQSPYFLTFLRKAYGSAGLPHDFLGLDDEVEIELRDTGIRFFTLSFDKLDNVETQLQTTFKDVKIEVPNFSAVSSQLREKLKTKTDEMNQGKCRAQVVFLSESTVYLLGHTKEVEELSETVTQFILDHSNIESKVMLRFPELAHELSQLLELHHFDKSGVVFHTIASSSGPMMLLEGPSSKVTEVRNRLGPFLDTLVKSKLTIDLPGAMRYFESPSGREVCSSISHSHKCLIQLQEPHLTRQNWVSGARLNNGGTTVASYNLCGGLQVLVCQGDITKQDADVLVNAANEDLDHGGGVAAALSKAGGPAVQKESKALVKQTGKIPVGDVVVTTGGNLKCKSLLHAVGPVGGKVGGRESFLLKKTVTSALNLAEMMEFKSIAMPCISSGLFGVPVSLCSEAIVTAVKEFGSQGGRSLSKIILIDNRGEVVRAMHEACDRILQGMSTGNSKSSDLGFYTEPAAKDSARGATAGATGEAVSVKIVLGTIETQQVDGLVSPMVGHDPLSTRVGNVLYNVVGPQLTANFHKEAKGATLPTDTIMVPHLPGLQCKAVIFLNLAFWDNNQHGAAVQILKQGIRNILASCEMSGFTSVAFPVLGTGAALRFPHSVASRALLEEISVFEQNRTSRSPFLVRVVIHPSDKESNKAFQSAQAALHLRGFTNDTNPDQASFYRHVSVHNEEVTSLIGKVKLQMVQGDIINEDTDAIVNTTDFSNNQSGVSKAILTAAGPTVQAALAQVGIPPDYMCHTEPGFLHCKEIIHASFKCDSQVIQKNCKKILKQCESRGYRSVAFPAINTGMAGMDSVKACKAMLDGMASAIRDLNPKSLSIIRIVILQPQVFQVFKSELENRFGLSAPSLPLIEIAKQKLQKVQERCSRTRRPSSAKETKTLYSSKPQPAVIHVICQGQDTVETMKRDLEGILQKQLVERTIEVHDFNQLDEMELEAVLAKVKVSGVSLEHRNKKSSEHQDGNRAGNTARDQPGSSEEVCVLKGLKEDVLSITELVNKSVNKALHEHLQEKQEAMLAFTVQWSIQDVNGDWQELSLRDNYMLEDAHMRQKVSVEVMGPGGVMVQINLSALEATDWLSGLTYKVKRTETKIISELPDNWEPMNSELFKKVELKPNSSEYQKIAKGFLKTAKYNIQKIERVQNVYLWRAFSVCKERIHAKNGPNDLGEKFLYHGTSEKSCQCIERDRFDRNYAGTHGALYGNGVYFAVNANYSASRYSPADASGLKRMYVARVLTGRYTVGTAGMKAPPPRATDPTDCFDSLVDNQQQPNMFVIFHDDQAYPEHLITFK